MSLNNTITLKRGLLWIAIHLAIHAESFCQGYSFEFIDFRNGLSQSCGNAIVKQNGYLWFGTQDGLNRYDGTRIHVYGSSTYPVIQSNYINALVPQDAQMLWVGTTQGLYKLNTELDTLTQILPDQIHHVKRLYVDSHKNIWTTSQNDTLKVINPKIDRCRTIPEFNEERVIGFSEYDGLLFIATDTKLFSYDSQDEFLTEIPIPSENNHKFEYSTSFYIDAKGIFWIGTFGNGIIRFTYQSGTLSPLDHFTSANTSLEIDEISAISQDAQKNMWIGTRSASMFIFKDGQWIVVNDNLQNKSKYIKGYIFCFYHDDQGITWIGTDGDGIGKYDPQTIKFNTILPQYYPDYDIEKGECIFHIAGNNNKVYFAIKDVCLTGYDERTKSITTYTDLHPYYLNNHPRQILIDSSGIYIGSDKGVRIFDPKSNAYAKASSFDKYIYTICLVNDQLWTGGTEGLQLLNKSDLTPIPLDPIDPLRAISKYLIRILYRDRKGNVWIGTTGQGLFHYTPSSQVVREINKNKDFDCKSIRCFHESEKCMYIGTDCGYYKINDSFDIDLKVSTANGLPNNVVYSIEQSIRSGLWIGSNAGLTYISEDLQKIKTYTISDGIPGNEFNTNASYRSDSGILYFGGMKGITSFDETLLKPNTYRSYLKIAELQVEDVPLHPSDWLKDSSVTLSYTQKRLNIKLSVSNYANCQNNYCLYKLDGINDWTRVPTSNELTFTGLAYGKYTLTIRGFNNDDYECINKASLQILIPPPFWKSKWFYGLLIVLPLALIYAWKSKELKAREKELRYKNEIQNIRNLALRSQMNPHFIFNCMSAIEYLMISGSKEKAHQYLNKFSRLMRNTLHFTSYEVVTLNEELNHLNLYVSLENLRYNNEIKMTTIIEEPVDPDTLFVPPLLLQPIVENCFKHSFSATSTHPEININISMAERYCVISITDNGRGYNPSTNSVSDAKEKSYGLAITRQRLQLYGDKANVKTHFEISNIEGPNRHGAQIVISIEQ